MKIVLKALKTGYRVYDTVSCTYERYSASELLKHPEIKGVSDDGIIVYDSLQAYMDILNVQWEMFGDGVPIPYQIQDADTKHPTIRVKASRDAVLSFIESNVDVVIPDYLSIFPTSLDHLHGWAGTIRSWDSDTVCHFPYGFFSPAACGKAKGIESFRSSMLYVGDSLFEKCGTLRSVDIRFVKTRQMETGCSIQKYAFRCCNELQHVRLSGQLAIIGSFSFMDCRKLTQVELCDVPLKEIRQSAFENSGIRTFTAPKTMHTLGITAFRASSLESVDLGDCVVLAIPMMCFENCKSLSSVVLPKDCNSLEVDCFSGCSALETLEMPAGVYHLREDALPAGIRLLIPKGSATERTVYRCQKDYARPLWQVVEI